MDLKTPLKLLRHFKKPYPTRNPKDYDLPGAKGTIKGGPPPILFLGGESQGAKPEVLRVLRIGM